MDRVQEEPVTANELDLPLMSNIEEISVYHYVLKLKCFIEKKEFHGCITLFCKPNEADKAKKQPSGTSVVKVESFSNKPDIKKVVSIIGNDHEYSKGSNASNVMCNACNTNESKTETNLEKGDNLDIIQACEPMSHDDSEESMTMSHQIHSDEQLCTSDFSSLPVCQKTSKIINSAKQRNASFVEESDENVSFNLHSSQMLQPIRNQIFSNGQDTCNWSEGHDTDFCLILDSSCITVLSVEEIDVQNNFVIDDIWESYKHEIDPCDNNLSRQKGRPLSFCVEDNHIKIWKKGISNSEDFPKVVKITYHTQENGQSLKWTFDQDGQICTFTHGHWINNRSFFPSQDAPVAMATWQARIHVPRGLVVLMSGENNPTVVQKQDWTSFYFSTTKAMPSSTLSLAVGHWSEITRDQQNSVTSVCPISYRLFAPLTFSSACQELHRYIPVCLSVVTQVLGTHPFERQDILIVPSSFDSMGMASPCVLYLSQSVLAGDFSMFSNVAHELCHTWFGISIGPKDWTEEWLTEGFCAYLEEIVHTEVLMRLNILRTEEVEEYREIQCQLRYRTMVAEISHTKDDLQTLRPSQNLEDASSESKKFVKNGMNSEKRFLQVHYLKGYFLLRFLEETAGKERFLECIKKLTLKFYGCFVTSEDVVDFFLSSCTELREAGLTQAGLFEDWLNYPGMPKTMKEPVLKSDNNTARHVLEQVQTFKDKCKIWRRKKAHKRKMDILHDMAMLSPVQLLWFLELLLDEEKIQSILLNALKQKYKTAAQNADIQHRWCELVIKHKAERHYDDVKSFLVKHQGMGVYLFGELVLSGNTKQRQVAESCFQLIKAEMEPDPYKNVHAMLFGE